MKTRFAAAALLCLAIAAQPASAGITGVRAQVTAEKAVVGERVDFAIIIESDGQLSNVIPSQPDLGGLKLISGPSQSTQTVIVNFKQTSTIQVVYTVTSLDPGQFVIGPVRFEHEGKTYQTIPAKIEFIAATQDPAAQEAIPPSLRGEPLLFPNCEGSPESERQMHGLVFIRPSVSRPSPFVGEAFKYELNLYIDSRLMQTNLDPRRDLRVMQFPKFESLLTDEEFKAQSLNTRAEMIDGRQFQVSLLYRVYLTAPKPGDYALEGYGVQFTLAPPRTRAANPRFGDFMNDPFSRGGVPATLWAAPLKLAVRALPDNPQAGSVAPSVGQYSLDAALDRREASKSDIITLTMRVSGKGNIALASVPPFPANADIEAFDQTQKSEKKIDREGALSGTKTIEYLLRPLREGALTVPEIECVTFDPETSAYKTLKTAPMKVEVRASAEGAVAAIPAGGSAPPARLEGGMRYIKPVVDVTMTAPRPLIESPLFWAPQVAALAAAAASIFSARRRDRLDPAQVRRDGARGALQKKLARLPDANASQALERALREFVADRNNVSPEGLTGESMLKLLKGDGVAEDKARRVVQIADLCAGARYAPAGAGGGGFADLAKEALETLGAAPEIKEAEAK